MNTICSTMRSAEWFEAMRHRLSGEKLMVAFVAGVLARQVQN
ncbi:MAG: hypothetical protein QM749_07400 [Aquabacterium sp.]